MSDFWDHMNCSLPGSSVHGVSQARILEWVVISFSRGSSWLVGLNPHLLCLLYFRWILYCWAIRGPGTTVLFLWTEWQEIYVYVFYHILLLSLLILYLPIGLYVPGAGEHVNLIIACPIVPRTFNKRIQYLVIECEPYIKSLELLNIRTPVFFYTSSQ